MFIIYTHSHFKQVKVSYKNKPNKKKKVGKISERKK